MAQKNQVYETSVKHSGYWNFSDVYTMMYDYLKGEGYSVNEKSYKESVSDTKEISIEWEASRKVTDYFKYTITVKIDVTRLKDVEVEIDGQVKKTNKGDLKVGIKGFFIKDYDGKWEDKPMNKFLRGLYEKYIISSSIDEYSGILSGEASGLTKELRAFLKLSA